MTASIIKREKDSIVVEWSDSNMGFGQLTMLWDYDNSRFILDSENMGIETTLRIIQAIQI